MVDTQHRSSPPSKQLIQPQSFRSKRVVVKIGSALLTPSGPLGHEAFQMIADEVIKLTDRGMRVVLVSSGAIAQGRLQRGLDKRPKKLSEAQALAAVGQPLLMKKWAEALAPLDVAQVLLTLSDIEDPTRFLNARRALNALADSGIIAIGNENDTVATDEIKIGDNDTLGAHVAKLFSADLLILLTQVEGLYTADPQQDPCAAKIDVIKHGDDVTQFAGGSSSDGWGRGGMITKVKAAAIAGKAGIPTLIGHGKYPLTQLIDQPRLGTFFEPTHTPGYGFISTWPVSGALYIHHAEWEQMQRNRVLCIDQLDRIEGTFSRGALVEISLTSGQAVARGLTGYGSLDICRVIHLPKVEQANALGDEFDGPVCCATDWAELPSN